MSNYIPVSSRMACAGCGADMWRSKTSLPEGVARCRECRRVHGSPGFWRNGCRCEVCRAAQAMRMREYAAKRKAAGNPIHKTKAAVERVCEFCGEAFMARVDGLNRGLGRFCSADCRDRFQLDPNGRRAKAREYARKYGPPGSVRRRALRRAAAALRLSGGGRVLVQGACIVCGAGFTGIGRFVRHCSDECAKRNAPAAFGIRRPDRMYLYDRDEWKCHLCGLEVVYGVDDYDPRMASLDHLVPQSLGGGHEFENLATAHALCNSIRQDRPVDEFRSDEAVAMLRSRLADSMGVAA